MDAQPRKTRGTKQIALTVGQFVRIRIPAGTPLAEIEIELINADRRRGILAVSAPLEVRISDAMEAG